MNFFDGIAGKKKKTPDDGGFAAKKVCISIYHKGQFVDKKLFPSGNIRVGRSSEMTLPIYDVSISKFHLSIFSKNGSFYAEDGGSTNGTTLNGKKIKRVRLQGGERLTIGRTELLIEFPGGDAPLITDAWVPEEDTNVNELNLLNTQERELELRQQQAQQQARPVAQHEDWEADSRQATMPKQAAPHYEKTPGLGQPLAPVESDDDDDDEEAFEAPYSLREKLLDKQKQNAPPPGTPGIVEVVQFQGEYIQDVHQLQGRASLKVKMLDPLYSQGKPRLRKWTVVQAFGQDQCEIYFTADCSGQLYTDKGAIALKQLFVPQYLKKQSQGLYAFPLKRGEAAEVKVNETSYFIHYQKLPRVPREEIKLFPTTKIFKPLGSSAGTHLILLLLLGILHHYFGTDFDELYSRKNLERFVKVDMSQLEATPAPTPIATPAPTPAPKAVAKKAKKPPKRVKKKKAPRKKVARKKRSKPRSKKLVRRPSRVKGKGRGSVKVSKLGALGSLGTISTGNKKKQAKMMAAVSNLHAVRTDNGSQAFSTSGLMGKVKGGGVKIVRVADVNTKGLGGGNKNFGLAGGVAGKVGGKGVGGQVSIDEETTEDVMVSGSLTVEEVQRVIMRHLNDIRYCYEKQLMKNAGLQGKAKMAWTIKANGRVSVARVASSSLRSNAVHQCMIRNIKTWKFPKPRGGGGVEVTFPFVFNQVSF